MSQPKRATVYLNPELHRALKLKSVQMDRSVSEIVNEAVRTSLKEDALDLEAVERRKNEKTRSFESFVQEMRKNGLL